jgi:hypothetical protein
VTITVVVTEVVLVVLVDVLPGLSMSPAITATASVRLRIVAAYIRRKVLILVAPKMRYKNFVCTLEQP